MKIAIFAVWYSQTAIVRDEMYHSIYQSGTVVPIKLKLHYAIKIIL